MAEAGKHALEIGPDKNPANFAPLTPLVDDRQHLLERRRGGAAPAAQQLCNQ